MTIAAMAGPLIIYGQNPSQAGTNYQTDYNGDYGPSAVSGGLMLLDPRFGYRASLQAGSLAALGTVSAVTLLLIDQVPATAAAANIAALANVVSGTPMTMVAVTGAGITVSTSALSFNITGVTLPIGTRYIDGPPALLVFGQSGSVCGQDPRTMIGRAVSISASAAASGGNFLVRGFDVYGFPMTEQITAVTNTTVNGLRGFKAVTSITPQFTNPQNYSVGTADIFEFPLMATTFAQATIYWNNGPISAISGFVTGVGITATATSGSERGTFATPTASDGTRRLQMTLNPAPYNMQAVNGANSLFGPTRYSA